MAATASSFTTTKDSSELAEARAELYYALTEGLPLDVIQRYLDATLKLGGNINTAYSTKKGDRLDDVLSPIETCISIYNREALRLFLRIKGAQMVNPHPVGSLSLLALASAYGDEVAVDEMLNYSEPKGVNANCFHTETPLSAAINTLSDYPILFHGEWATSQLQQDAIDWWTGTKDFNITAPVTVRYYGALPTVQKLLAAGANPQISTVKNISPLEVVTDPVSLTKILTNMADAFTLSDSVKFLRATPQDALLFEKTLICRIDPDKKLTINVEYDFSRLKPLLEEAKNNPKNQGGYDQVREYRLQEQLRQHALNATKHQAHVLEMRARLEEAKIAAEEEAAAAADMAGHAAVIARMARESALQAHDASNNVAADAKGAIDAQKAREFREQQLKAIAANSGQYAFFHTIGMGLKAIFTAATLLGDPTGAKIDRAKTTLGDQSADLVKVVSAQIPGIGLAGAVVSTAITAAVNHIEASKQKKIGKAVPLRSDEAAEDIAFGITQFFLKNTPTFALLNRLEHAKSIKESEKFAVKFIQFFSKYLVAHEIDPSIGIVETLSNAPLQDKGIKEYGMALAKKLNATPARVEAARVAGVAASAAKENIVIINTVDRSRGAAVISPTGGPASGATPLPSKPSFFDRARKAFS
jgi:hypothetical protein